MASAAAAGTIAVSGSDVGDVVGDINSGQRLGEKQREQQKHHPAARGVVAHLPVGLPKEYVFQVLKGDPR